MSRDRYERRHRATRIDTMLRNDPTLGNPGRDVVTLDHAMNFFADETCGDPECLCARRSPPSLRADVLAGE